MTKKRKSYVVAPSPSSLNEKPSSLLISFVDEHGDLVQQFTLTRYSSRRQMAAELALAFRHYGASRRAETRKGTLWATRVWFRFLDETRSNAMSFRQVDTALVRSYIAWLERSAYTRSGRFGAWNAVKQLFSWLQRFRPELVHPNLELPFNAIPRPQSESKPVPALSRTEIERVLKAAREEVTQTWGRFQEGQRLLAAVDAAAVTAETDVRTLKVRDLGVLLAIVVRRYGGLFPSASALVQRGGGTGTILKGIALHGGADRVAQHLYATLENLIPYIILIGAQSYANVGPLLAMRRDCMTEHVLLEGRVMVTWEKARARRPQRRSFLRAPAFSVPRLIDQVLALTAPLVLRTREKHRNRLFLAARINSSRHVGIVDTNAIARRVRAFPQRHGLLDDAGAPLRFTLASLRPTGLKLAHEALGHDVFKTQLLANHADVATTERYLDGVALRTQHAVEIERLQVQFVGNVRAGVLWHRRARKPPPRTNTRSATAAGFRCRDPMEGVGPGQKPGSLCTAWLGCFTCPNAVIPLDVDVLARLLVARDALLDAKVRLAPERWALIYAPKLEILDRDILPRFAAAQRAKAVTRMKALPPTPPIE